MKVHMAIAVNNQEVTYQEIISLNPWGKNKFEERKFKLSYSQLISYNVKFIYKSKDNKMQILRMGIFTLIVLQLEE